MYFARSSRDVSLFAAANFLGTATAQVVFAGAWYNHVMPIAASSALAVSYVRVALCRTEGSTLMLLWKTVTAFAVYSGYTSICFLINASRTTCVAPVRVLSTTVKP